MATGTVDPSSTNEAQGSSIPSKRSDVNADELHEREKQMVASVRPPNQRQMSPFVITERPEEKHLGISTRSLTVDDFALLKTLGTGKLR